MTLVEVQGATVRFDGRPAIDGIDLVVAAGEVVAVVGPSGSGKSTLLRAVAGLQRLDAGTVRLRGRTVDDVPPHRRGVGMMFQHHALFPHQDVAGNIAFGLRRQGWRGPRVAARVDELLDLVGLPGFGPRPVAELSGGEQQRVALARALAPAPDVLLLDEPMGALDHGLRQRLVRDVRATIRALGLTVVAVTHDPSEAFALADRIVVLDAGRVRQEGTPEALWRAPADAAVVGVLGLGQVLTVEVEDGVARTPWGPAPVPGPDGRAALLLRPDAVQRDDGGVPATVVAATFQGATAAAEVAVDGADPVAVAVSPGDLPAVGTTLPVAVRPASVVRLDP